MHIIGILITIASLIYWISLALRGANEISNQAKRYKNRPKAKRFEKTAKQTALETIQTPIEAATMLMVVCARLGKSSNLTQDHSNHIIGLLQSHMKLDAETADDHVVQMNAIAEQFFQNESIIIPMVDVLKNEISKDDAIELSDMLTTISGIDGTANTRQKNMIHKYQERIGLLN